MSNQYAVLNFKLKLIDVISMDYVQVITTQLIFIRNTIIFSVCNMSLIPFCSPKQISEVSWEFIEDIPTKFWKYFFGFFKEQGKGENMYMSKLICHPKTQLLSYMKAKIKSRDT